MVGFWIILSIFWVVAFTLIFAWASYKKEPFGWILIIAALFMLFLSIILSKITDFSKLGPVGDWFAGSTSPFLTLATFWMAFKTYEAQRVQIDIAKKDSFDSRRQQVIPFLHLEVLGNSLHNSPHSGVERIIYREELESGFSTFGNPIRMQELSYESVHIKLTNIGIGLATQLLLDSFEGDYVGRDYKGVYITDDSHKDLNHFFIETSKSREFLIFFPIDNSKTEHNYTFKLSYHDIIGNPYSQEYMFYVSSISSVIFGENSHYRNYTVKMKSQGHPTLSNEEPTPKD